MASQWTTKTLDWNVKPTFFSATAGRTGFHGTFRMAIYSAKTGFLADVSMNGSAAGIGGNITFDLSDQWMGLDQTRSFSPDDLHGAAGSLKFGGLGALVGSSLIYGSARLKGTKDYLFEDANISEAGMGLGISAGYVRGQWKIDHVWSSAGIPGSQPQAATESVGGGDARPASSGMSETG